MANDRLPGLPTTGAKRAVTLPRNGRSKDSGQGRLEELGYHQELSRQGNPHTVCQWCPSLLSLSPTALINSFALHSLRTSCV